MSETNQPLLQPTDGQRNAGASFSRRNRLVRAVWQLTWTLLAGWTPPPLHAWRITLLRAFGAKIGKGARIYGSTIVWLPSNLAVGDGSIIGPRVRVYNQGHITIGANSVVSQGAHLCASTHDYEAPNFQLVLRPIVIGNDAWVAADAFVGPGITIGDGAVLAARGVAVRHIEPWSVQGGNPARLIRMRTAPGQETAG